MTPTKDNPLGIADIRMQDLTNELLEYAINQLSVLRTLNILRSKILDKSLIPPSREASLAMTKLDECELWLKEADRVMHQEGKHR